MLRIYRNHVDCDGLIARRDVLRPVFVVSTVLALRFQVEDDGCRVFLFYQGLKFPLGEVHLLHLLALDSSSHFRVSFDPIIDRRNVTANAVSDQGDVTSAVLYRLDKLFFFVSHFLMFGFFGFLPNGGAVNPRKGASIKQGLETLIVFHLLHSLLVPFLRNVSR